MKKIILTLTAVFFAMALKGETLNTADDGNGFLRGRLFDSQTREPLMFASVALLADADSSLLTGVITDED